MDAFLFGCDLRSVILPPATLECLLTLARIWKICVPRCLEQRCCLLLKSGHIIDGEVVNPACNVGPYVSSTFSADSVLYLICDCAILVSDELSNVFPDCNYLYSSELCVSQVYIGCVFLSPGGLFLIIND